ncbi:MAG: hypothetical protein AAJB65_00330 [Candidatus Hodgkinia cicadicola]
MLIISSIRSDDGKTAITCGLASIFYKLGLDFDLIKVGPDYLDSLCISNYANVNRINLVSQSSKQFYRWLSWAKPCSLIEDCVGIMDSIEGRKATTPALFSFSNNKIVLVLNCENVIQTVTYLSPIIFGALSGVILNNVASCRHEMAISEAVKYTIGVPILGVLKKSKPFFAKQHLGVVQLNSLLDLPNRVSDLMIQIYYNCNIFELVKLLLASGN